jgi:two-component system cell cycle sensor histidine kinase/response regulator CckA
MSLNGRDPADSNDREEDNRFRLFFEHAPLYCYMISPQGIILDVNQAALRALGYSRVELIGKHIRTIYAPESQDKVQQIFQTWKDNDSLSEEQLIIQNKEGHQRTVLLSANAIRDNDGRFLYSISIQKDISEQKEIEQALLETELSLKKVGEEQSVILNSISEHVIYQDMDNRILWANRAAADSVNLTIDEITGRFCYEIWNQRESPCEGCPIVEARNTGEIKENEMRTPDGRVWFIRGYPLKDKEGNINGCVEVTTDITEWKRTEEAYHSLVDQSLQGLFIIQNSRIVFVNPAFVQISGYSEEEILTFGPGEIFEIIHPEDRHLPLNQLHNIIHGEPIASSIELRGVLKDGSSRWLQLSLAVIEFQGKPATQATIIDIHDRKVADDALRRERDRAQMYLDMAGVLFIAVDPKGQITMINRKASEVLGFTEDELLGKNYFDTCIPENLRDNMRENFRAIMSGEIEPKSFVENAILTKDGVERIISWHSARLYDDEGNVIGGLTTGEDITERKVAEEALKKSGEQFRLLVEDTADWVWEVDQEFKFTYSNSSVEDILGYTAGQIIGRELWDLIEPSEVEEIQTTFSEKGNQNRSFRSLVNHFFHRDGNTLLLETSSRPIFDETSQVIGYRGVCRDITQRMIADEILKQSEARYRALVETSPDAITVTDPEGNITLVNDRTIKLLGYDAIEELIGKSCFDFVVPEERKRSIEDIESLKETSLTKPEQFTLIHKDGSTFPAEISASILYGAEGKPSGYILVTRDITERKKAEEELEEAKARAEFFTDLMAHDLNNINQAILSALELQLYDPDVPQPLREQLQVSLEQVERSSALIGRVRKFSRIDATKPILEVRDLEPDFQSALNAVKQAFPKKTIRIDTNIHPRKYKILADDLLVDLFYNLLHNATKFDRHEKVEIEVKASPDDNKRFLRIEVSDRGPGISDELKKLIFARYTRRIGEKAQGSGIGLTLVQRIIERYGGQIWVENRIEEDYSKGAKFVFLLPIWK